MDGYIVKKLQTQQRIILSLVLYNIGILIVFLFKAKLQIVL